MGGAERSLLELAAALSTRGHALHLGYEMPGEFLPRYESLCESTFRLPTVRLQTHSRRALLSLLRSAARAAGVRPDVVHVNMSLEAIYGAFTALAARSALICHLRYRPPASFERLDRFSLARVTRFIAVSDYIRGRWAKMGLDPARVQVVHNGVDPLQYHPPSEVARIETRKRLGISRSDALVLYAGRIWPGKGIETLLEAFQRLTRLVTQAQLRLVCCPTVPGKEGYARRLHARPGPWVWSRAQTDMPALYGAADLVVVPSTGAEAFARVPIEAMACGCPVVASRSGGLPELFTGRFEQLLVPPGDAAALAAKLEWALRWREHSPDLGRRCREHVATSFTLERTRAGVEEVLLNAVEEQDRSRSAPLNGGLLAWRRRAVAMRTDSPVS